MGDIIRFPREDMLLQAKDVQSMLNITYSQALEIMRVAGFRIGTGRRYYTTRKAVKAYVEKMCSRNL